MQNRRRKRLSSSPCRVVKRARSMDRSEMRPFIKQIEDLKSEKYQLEQKIKNFEKTEIPENFENFRSLESLADENEMLRQQVAEFQIQADHQNSEIVNLRHQRDAAIENLGAANSEIVEFSEKNQNLESQIIQISQTASAIEFAKNMLSESLREMIRDYQMLSGQSGAQRNAYEAEIGALKADMQKMEKSCKEGALKIAQTAKIELQKVHEENFRSKKIIEDLMDQSAKSQRVKCSICLGVKNLTDFSISNPCGHVHCKNCAEKLNKSQKNKNCPSCRGPVSAMVKIFA
jgi:chromosome segregation ATPase